MLGRELLSAPNEHFGGEVPLTLLESDAGAAGDMADMERWIAEHPTTPRTEQPNTAQQRTGVRGRWIREYPCPVLAWRHKPITAQCLAGR
nr:antitoxin Xre/MbcA/ParS toxin-binding domain-containing protein [Cupriavidus pauculus]